LVARGPAPGEGGPLTHRAARAQVADENGLEIIRQMDSAKVGQATPAQGQAEPSVAEEDALSRRLAQLRAA
jgi:hypothetical protein